MKSKYSSRPALASTIVAVLFCNLAAQAGTSSTTFSFQQGDLQKDGSPYGSASSYAGIVDGRVTDNTATSPQRRPQASHLKSKFLGASQSPERRGWRS